MDIISALMLLAIGPDAHDLLAAYVVTVHVLGLVITLQRGFFEFRQGLDATIGEDIFTQGKRALLLVHAVALNDAGAAELALILLFTATLSFMQEGIQLLFDIHQPAVERLPSLFDDRHPEARLVGEHWHAIVGVGGHAERGAALHLLNWVAHGVDSAVRGQEVPLVFSLLSLDFADRLVEGVESTRVLADGLSSAVLRDWIDAQLGRGVTIFQLGARLWIRHFTRRSVACVRVSVIYVHFLAELL